MKNLIILAVWLGAFCQAQAQTPAQLPTGGVGWWRGNTNAMDSVGSNNGTWSGTPSYTTGVVQAGFTFNGNHVEIPDSASLDQFTTNLSIELWVKGVWSIGDWNMLVSKDDNGYEVRVNPGSDHIGFSVNGTTAYYLAGSRNVNDGNWHHIACVYDSTNLYLYSDGTLDTQVAATGTIDCNPGVALWFGDDPVHIQRTFNGSIDEVTLYNAALTANQVAAIYAAGSAGKVVSTNLYIEPWNEPAPIQLLTNGSTGTIAFTNGGFTPFGYEWFQNGVPMTDGAGVAGSGTSNLTFNLVNAAVAAYFCVITNNSGSITSQVAFVALLGYPVQLPSGCVGWWRGNTNAMDSVGSNNGTWSGTPSYTTGEVLEAFTFSSNHVEIADSASLDQFTNSLTIELWVKGVWNINDWDGMVGKGNNGYEVRVNSGSGGIGFVVNGTTAVAIGGTRNVNDGNWHHVACVYDSTNMSIYTDGTLDTQVAYTGTINCDPGGVFMLGLDPYSPGSLRQFTGSLDEVAIYNRALSPLEILSIYAAGSRGKTMPVIPGATTFNPAPWLMLGN